jgi:hypothetical protein
LLTTFLICKATDVANLLLAKDKVKVICNSGTCENQDAEETENLVDDQQIASHLAFTKVPVSVLLKTVFSYTVLCDNEIYRNLVSPPPELV